MYWETHETKQQMLSTSSTQYQTDPLPVDLHANTSINSEQNG